jgi:hypothetical protein
VGTFDEAFSSRIQVALHYGPLTKKSRKQIWQNFFDMLEEQEVDVNMAEFENRLDELAAEDMNGRQIRNCLLTAQQLAFLQQRTVRVGTFVAGSQNCWQFPALFEEYTRTQR